MTIARQPFVAFAKEHIEQSIPARFEQQVVTHPDRLAVGTAHHSLTYQQLDRLANRVAHGILARRGEGSEPIGLLIEQGARCIAAVLGALKAGKMYVPLDPTDPVSRSAFTATDAGISLILADGPELAAADALAVSGRSIVSFDELVSSQPEHSPALALSADTPAYIYYTSGSTGRPKGVWDIHRNVLHNIMRYTNSLQIAADDRLTLLQSPVFSGAVSSMFNALLNGAAVFPYDVRKQGMGRALGDWLTCEELTMYHSVPMIFRSFLTGGVRFPHIRVIRLEGDVATKVDVELYRAHFEPDCRLVNGLGATETGISRQFFMDKDTPLRDGVVPIGYGTEDMHGMVIDEAGQDVGIGVVGEIAIRSRYLAPGYWNLPALTRTAFLSGRAGTGERIYRTGDLGRMSSGQCLEYLGRRDAGLKVRGHRVEPAEVERALLSLDAIQEAVAVIHEDSRGPRLLAYLVSAGTPALPVSVLRRRLGTLLPEYMIPTRFLFLERLPFSPNGKIDRRALPAPDQVPMERATEYVPPRDHLESQLVKIWEELLHFSPIGITDNFFDCGGDSLTAAALFSAMEAIPVKGLLPAALIDAPTISQMVRLIRDPHSMGHAVLVPVQTDGTLPPFFCVPAHYEQVVGLAGLSQALGDGQPFYGLQPVGLSGHEHPLTSIEAMAERFVEAVREVQPHGPYYLGGRCFGAIVALAMAHRLTAIGEPIGLLCFMDVSPSDFPGLASEESRRRFRDYRRREVVRSVWRDTRNRRMWQRLPSAALELVRWATRTTISLGRKALIRGCLALQWPLPRLLRDVNFLNRDAFVRHTSRAYPGRATLILSTEHLALYGGDPAPHWKDLATLGCDMHYVTGGDDAMFREPGVRSLAHLLASALRAARG